jgi:hypothetical protein
MTQHRGLTADRWSRFSREQQILMIGNEMNRTAKVLTDAGGASRRLGYERILRLTDLTIASDPRAALRRELLRWRDLVAQLYVAETADPDTHRVLFRTLLQLHPVAARQVPLLIA